MTKKKLVSFLILLASLIIFLNIEHTNYSLKETLSLWLNNIIPTIPVSFFLGNLIYIYYDFLTPFYIFFQKLFFFENKTSFILYIISFIVGTPTSTILITNAYKNNEISKKETQRLLRSTSFVSLFFILFVLPPYVSVPIILGQISSSFIINKKDKTSKKEFYKLNSQINIFHIIEKLPVVLLTILSTMILTTIIKIPFETFFKESLYFIPTTLSFLEITSGIKVLTSLYSNFILLFFSSLLVSFHGLAILLQVVLQIKEKMLNVTDYLKYRLIHAFLATAFSILFYLLFKLFL